GDGGRLIGRPQIVVSYDIGDARCSHARIIGEYRYKGSAAGRAAGIGVVIERHVISGTAQSVGIGEHEYAAAECAILGAQQIVDFTFCVDRVGADVENNQVR